MTSVDPNNRNQFGGHIGIFQHKITHETDIVTVSNAFQPTHNGQKCESELQSYMPTTGAQGIRHGIL
jgi:hypothetical protein